MEKIFLQTVSPSMNKIFLLLVCLIPLNLQAFDNIGLMDTVHSHVAAIRDHELGTAYYQFTSQDYRDDTSLKEFEKFIKQFPALYNNESITLGTILFEEHIGVYKGMLKDEGGNEAYIEYYLTKDGIKWKIVAFKIFPAP